MVIFKIPDGGGFPDARVSYDRVGLIRRDGDSRRGFVLLPDSKFITGYYEDGKGGDNRFFASGRQLFRVFRGNICVLFCNPFSAAFDLFGLVFLAVVLIMARDIAIRVAVAVLLPFLIYDAARKINEQFELKKMITGKKDKERGT